MYEVALDILKKFQLNGYKAYIVGGYPRDKYINIKSNDIDICTNAKTDEIEKIFLNVDKKYSKYGNVIVNVDNYLFSITTFRKDVKYLSNRRNVIIEYVSTLKEDLYRRDFIINTLCIDLDGNYIDLMGAIDDINNKKIRLIGNIKRLKDDPLRILRAIRFATILNFKIDEYLEKGIYKYKHLVDSLSLYRKDEEINKILLSDNKQYGISLLLKYGLDNYIDLKGKI